MRAKPGGVDKDMILLIITLVGFVCVFGVVESIINCGYADKDRYGSYLVYGHLYVLSISTGVYFYLTMI